MKKDLPVARTAKTSLLSRTTHLRTSYCFSFKPRISKPKVTAVGQPFWNCSKPTQNDRKSAICGLQIGTGQSLRSVVLAEKNTALGTRMISRWFEKLGFLENKAHQNHDIFAQLMAMHESRS